MLSSVEYIGESRSLHLYEVVLVLWVWRLQQREDCRMVVDSEHVRTLHFAERMRPGKVSLRAFVLQCMHKDRLTHTTDRTDGGCLRRIQKARAAPGRRPPHPTVFDRRSAPRVRACSSPAA